MDTIKVRTYVGSDGILKLEVPVGMTNRDYEIVVVIQPTEAQTDELGWPIGFFEETYGSLSDDPIEREPQGEPDKRDNIE